MTDEYRTYYCVPRIRDNFSLARYTRLHGNRKTDERSRQACKLVRDVAAVLSDVFVFMPDERAMGSLCVRHSHLMRDERGAENEREG